jgi:hypothetical protein
MASREDTRFDMPSVDSPASTEVGVILLGLDAERLLAGLGMATLADDPTAVALSVDHVRHGVAAIAPSAEALVEAGCLRWTAASGALAALAPELSGSASPRQAWPKAERLVETLDPLGTGPACRAYLTACWLRRNEIDRWVEDHTCRT